MKNFCFVTALYVKENIRGRGVGYYTGSLNGFIKSTDFPIVVFTDAPELIHKREGVEIREGFEFYEVPGGMHFPPKQLTMYLSKIKMVLEASRDYEHVFWIDAGFSNSYFRYQGARDDKAVGGHTLDRFCRDNIDKLKKFCVDITKNNDHAFSWVRQHWSRIDQNFFNRDTRQITGCFFYVSREFVRGFEPIYRSTSKELHARGIPVTEEDTIRYLQPDLKLNTVFTRELLDLFNLPVSFMKKILCTLNVHKDVIDENARASMREAARRWGADYVEILALTGPEEHQQPYCQKLYLDKHLPDDARIIFFDGDVVIRYDCPSPFDIVPEGNFGAIRNHYPSHAGCSQHVYGPMKDYAGKLGIDFTRDMVHDIYQNDGLLMFDFPKHRKVFERARKIINEIGFDNYWPLADQGPITLANLIEKTDVFFLPPMFNYAGEALWSGWSPEMKTFVYHFCGGCLDRWIPRTIWDAGGPDRKLKGTNCVRWHDGKPSALLDGREIPMFIREVAKIRKGVVVEIGSYMGGTAWYGAQIARDNYSEYFCIDPWNFQGDIHVGAVHYRAFKENMKDAGLEDHVQIRKNTNTVACEEFEDESVDLVFVDGDHTYEGVSGDIRRWWAKLKPGGIMLGHDYCQRFPGIISAVEEILGGPDEVSPGNYPIWKKTKCDALQEA